MENVLLEVQGLETQFITPDGTVHAINGVSFSVANGETIGLVGESGCGKSVTMLSVLGLLPTPPGKIVAGMARFHGQDLLKLSEVQLQKIRIAARCSYVAEKCRQANPILEEIAPDHRVACWVKPKTRSVQP